MTKKGDQLLEAGMYSEAALYYYNALLRKRDNIDAKLGLTNTGQRVYDEKLDVFTKAKAMGEHKQAVYAYKDALDYKVKLEGVGVKLESPSYMADDFEEAKLVYADHLYREGKRFLDEKNFPEAEKFLKELLSLEKSYKDASDLLNTAVNEPHYLEGKALFEKGMYRKAYYEFDKVYQTDDTYKEVNIYRSNCLVKGKYPVAISPFENASGQKDVEKRVNAYVITELANIDNPFLKVVDRAQMDAILAEQRLGMSGVVDEETAAEAGNLLGAKIMITGTVLSYTPTKGRIRTEEKRGYESYQVKKYDRENDRTYYETRYKPVTYKTHQGENKVSISFQYKCVSLESGEVLFSEVIEKNLKSSVNYASYDGEVKKLFPANAEGVSTSRSDRNELQSLIRSNRTLRSVDQLANEGFQSISNQLAHDIESHLDNL